MLQMRKRNVEGTKKSQECLQYPKIRVDGTIQGGSLISRSRSPFVDYSALRLVDVLSHCFQTIIIWKLDQGYSSW